MQRSLACTCAALLGLAGCAGTAKAPGATEVVFSNADTIKVQWDQVMSSEEYARSLAQAHCGDRAIEEIDAQTGLVSYVYFARSKTWRCVDRPGGK